MTKELLPALRAIIENAYVRATWGSVAVPETQRLVALEKFADDIARDMALLEGMIEHEATMLQTVLAADEPVLVLGGAP